MNKMLSAEILQNWYCSQCNDIWGKDEIYQSKTVETLNINGNIVSNESVEAHLPLNYLRK